MSIDYPSNNIPVGIVRFCNYIIIFFSRIELIIVLQKKKTINIYILPRYASIAGNSSQYLLYR